MLQALTLSCGICEPPSQHSGNQLLCDPVPTAQHVASGVLPLVLLHVKRAKKEDIPAAGVAPIKTSASVRCTVFVLRSEQRFSIDWSVERLHPRSVPSNLLPVFVEPLARAPLLYVECRSETVLAFHSHTVCGLLKGFQGPLSVCPYQSGGDEDPKRPPYA